MDDFNFKSGQALCDILLAIEGLIIVTEDNTELLLLKERLTTVFIKVTKNYVADKPDLREYIDETLFDLELQTLLQYQHIETVSI